MLKITAYTDGACAGNPGPGGWGFLLQAYKDGKLAKEITRCGGKKHTTNNQMELQAAIEALRTLSQPTQINVRTDSRYVRDGVTKWINKWRKNGWKLTDGTAVKNQELWQELDALCNRHEVEWEWVKGHAKIKGNERADKLAGKGMKPYLVKR